MVHSAGEWCRAGCFFFLPLIRLANLPVEMAKRRRKKKKHQKSTPAKKSGGPASTAWVWIVGLLVVSGLAFWLFTRPRSGADSLPLVSGPAPTNATSPSNIASIIQPLPPVLTPGLAYSTNPASPGIPTTKKSLMPTNMSPANRVMALLKAGSAFLAKGKYAEAASQYEAALKITPEDEDSHYNLGIAYAALGRTNDAIAQYEAALKDFPDYVSVHNNLGNLLLHLGRVDEAIAQFRASLETLPDNAPAHNDLGTALTRRRKYDEAAVEFAEAVRLDPDFLEARSNLASADLARNKVDSAIEGFETILVKHPNYEPAQRGLARARERKARQESGEAPPGPTPAPLGPE